MAAFYQWNWKRHLNFSIWKHNLLLYSLPEQTPKISVDVFIAPSADIIGDVTIGQQSSVWFQCLVRGDVCPISIGNFTNIQDNTVIHVTKDKFSTEIGDHVTIGHSAVIHGAILHDHSFVGMSASVLDGAIIHSYGFVAAGALVTPGFVVPEKSLVAGVPAKVIRELKEPEVNMIKESSKKYSELAAKYRRDLKMH